MPEAPEPARGWLLFALLSAFFAALTNILAKLGVAEINSNMATWIRVVVILVVLSPILYVRGEWMQPQSIPTKTLVFLALSGLATGASWLAYFRALQLGPVSLIAPIDKLSVVLVLVIGVAVLGERLSIRQWCGAGLILCGVALLAWPVKQVQP